MLQAVGVEGATTPSELSAGKMAALVLLCCYLVWGLLSKERTALSVVSGGFHFFGEAVVVPATVIASVT